MSAELPMYLKQLEALPSALDIIRLVGKHPQRAADMDDICDALGISERRFSKAIRRLVTNGYLQMRSDYSYELGRKGAQAVLDLAEYDQNAPEGREHGAGKLVRDFYIAMPRYLQADITTDVIFGFAGGSGFNTPTDVILRFDALHASLSTQDEMLKLGNRPYRHSLTFTPKLCTQARLRVQVFQLSLDGEDLTDCGGMFVDVDVTTEASETRLVAYRVPIEFTAL